jgi:threonylcarbamoyladenosine tRNA methylthiotransferase MtaB
LPHLVYILPYGLTKDSILGTITPVKVYIDALGCKLNQSEIEVLARRFAGAGHRLVGAPQDADLCVLNTCTVTHVAARKSRQALRRLHRANPEARIAAIGCYAEMEPEVVQDLPGIAWVVGNHDKERLVEWVAGPGREGPAPTLASRRTRGLVKIQDGCDNACSYCIVHVVRGAQRSRPPEEVLAEIVAAVAAGTQEIVLTGVHIGAYGRDTRRGLGDRQGFMDLWGLVRRILEETELPRLRLSSIEPWDAPSEEALALWADERLCAHLHLPLQAGADATLRRMGRRYSSAGRAWSLWRPWALRGCTCFRIRHERAHRPHACRLRCRLPPRWSEPPHCDE